MGGKRGEEPSVHKRPSGKYVGMVHDRLERTASGGKKYEYTAVFDNRVDALEAAYVKRAELDKKYKDTTTEWAEADPLTRGLPLGPYDAGEAEVGKVYWRPNPKDDHKPHRVVRGNMGKKGVKWFSACQHGLGADACTHEAKQAIKGGPPEFCRTHGGTCPHGKAWTTCRECNPNVTKMMTNCSVCAVQLYKKRMESNGGNGMCSTCEARGVAEAAENGSAPPPKGKKWEDVVLDDLVTLVVDTEGRVLMYESRDDMSNMLGSDKRRRKNECDTNHQRRPDLLYLVRDADSRIVAALLVEVDEHSHTDRKSECEAGKIDETFQSLLKLAQEEGKARLAETRSGTVRTPYVLFLKINPNACDAAATGGGAIKLETRVKVLARMCNEFLNTDPAVFHARSDVGECLVPHVQCLYYHTKEGAKHLAYFDEHAKGAWDWKGNACPRA